MYSESLKPESDFQEEELIIQGHKWKYKTVKSSVMLTLAEPEKKSVFPFENNKLQSNETSISWRNVFHLLHIMAASVPKILHVIRVYL